MKIATCVDLPLRLRSTLNLREHWAARHKRSRMERMAAVFVPVLPLPVTIRIVRIAPRPFDGDNLQASAKNLRDGIAARYGVDDGGDKIRWEYAQERARPKEYAVRVEIWKNEKR